MIFIGVGAAGRFFEEIKYTRTEFCPKKYIGQGNVYCKYCIIHKKRQDHVGSENIQARKHLPVPRPVKIKWSLPK